jgi:hypothetical protein
MNAATYLDIRRRAHEGAIEVAATFGRARLRATKDDVERWKRAIAAHLLDQAIAGTQRCEFATSSSASAD